MKSVARRGRRRGLDLLLLHCAALSGIEDTRPSPLERLEAVVGDEFAHLLLHGAAVSGAAGRTGLAA